MYNKVVLQVSYLLWNTWMTGQSISNLIVARPPPTLNQITLPLLCPCVQFSHTSFRHATCITEQQDHWHRMLWRFMYSVSHPLPSQPQHPCVQQKLWPTFVASLCGQQNRMHVVASWCLKATAGHPAFRLDESVVVSTNGQGTQESVISFTQQNGFSQLYNRFSVRVRWK